MTQDQILSLIASDPTLAAAIAAALQPKALIAPITLDEPTITLTDDAPVSMVLAAVERDCSASGKNDAVTYRFAALPSGGGYRAWTPLDKLPGAISTGKCDLWGRSASARHSKTMVEVAVPVGTLIKSVVKGQRSTRIERVTSGGLSAEGVQFIGTSKSPSGDWLTVVEIDGNRVSI